MPTGILTSKLLTLPTLIQIQNELTLKNPKIPPAPPTYHTAEKQILTTPPLPYTTPKPLATNNLNPSHIKHIGTGGEHMSSPHRQPAGIGEGNGRAHSTGTGWFLPHPLTPLLEYPSLSLNSIPPIPHIPENILPNETLTTTLKTPSSLTHAPHKTQKLNITPGSEGERTLDELPDQHKARRTTRLQEEHHNMEIHKRNYRSTSSPANPTKRKKTPDGMSHTEHQGNTLNENINHSTFNGHIGRAT